MSVFDDILAGHGFTRATVQLKSLGLRGKSAESKRAVMKSFVAAVNALGHVPTAEEGAEIVTAVSIKLMTGFSNVTGIVQSLTGLKFDQLLNAAGGSQPGTENAQQVAYQQSKAPTEPKSTQTVPTVAGAMPRGIKPAPATVFPGSVSTLITTGINSKSNSWMRETILGGDRGYFSFDSLVVPQVQNTIGAELGAHDSVAAASASIWHNGFDLATMTFDGATGSLYPDSQPHRGAEKIRKRLTRQPQS